MKLHEIDEIIELINEMRYNGRIDLQRWNHDEKKREQVRDLVIRALGMLLGAKE